MCEGRWTCSWKGSLVKRFRVWNSSAVREAAAGVTVELHDHLNEKCLLILWPPLVGYNPLYSLTITPNWLSLCRPAAFDKMAMHQFPLLVQWSSAPEIYHGFLSVMVIQMTSRRTGPSFLDSYLQLTCVYTSRTIGQGARSLHRNAKQWYRKDRTNTDKNRIKEHIKEQHTLK